MLDDARGVLRAVLVGPTSTGVQIEEHRVVAHLLVQPAAPAVRQIYDDIYGLEGHKAALPGGKLPHGLPKVSANGSITAPAGYGGSR